MGASQLWSWVLLLSTFFFWGARGESASGGAKGNGGESALELGVVRKGFCQEGVLSGSGLCQEGILPGKVFVRKRALPGRIFVRKGFCQEAGSARKEFCQERFLSGSGLCQEGILSGKVFVRKRALPGRGSQLWSWVVVSSSVFLFRGDGGQSASGAVKRRWGRVSFGGGVVLGFFVSGGRGPVSFRGCEGGMGASQLWSCVLRGMEASQLPGL